MNEDEAPELHGSDSMALVAKEYGWETAILVEVGEYEVSKKYHDIIYTLYAKRDLETLIVNWRGSLQSDAHYAYGDYHLYPAWRAGVIRLLKGKPNVKKFSARDKGKHSSHTYLELLKERNVPFEDDAPAFEIMLAVLGKDIRWVSNAHGVVRERNEFCPKESNLGSDAFRLHTTQSGKRVLNFANNFGFHACYVTDILEVS